MTGRTLIGRAIEDFEVWEQLGKGGFATVHRAQCRITGTHVAIKKINKSQIVAGRLTNRVEQEVAIHSRLNHPSILKLYTSFQDQQYVYLVLELCIKGELQKHIKNLGRLLTENEAREFLRQIVDGMLYLHSKSIIHRDLTLSNILLDDNQHVKIADFGLATQLRRPEDRHTTMCGTPNYISPEVVMHSHGLESDVWSLGCMLFIMLVGCPPFDGKGYKEDIFEKVLNDDYKLPSYVSAEARSLIASCLQKDAKERIKLELVPSHPFMTGKTDTSRVSADSGLYTMTTVATTHHTRQPLAAIAESQWSSEGTLHSSHHQQQQQQYQHQHPQQQQHQQQQHQHSSSGYRDPHIMRHPSSPPVKMKSSPRNLLPPNAGIIDSLKGKVALLPSLKLRDDFAFPPPSHLPRPRRERDVFEERHTHQSHQHPQHQQPHQQASDSKYWSYSSCEDKSSHNSGSSSVSTTVSEARGGNSSSSSRQGQGRCRKKSRSLEREYVLPETSDVRSGHYSGSGQGAQCYGSERCLVGALRPPTPQKHPPNNPHTTLRQQMSPLCTRRLKKFRLATKFNIFSILDNGEVCMEHLSVRHNQEVVDVVYRISPDGLKVVVYRPNGGAGVALGETPAPLPGDGGELNYSYEDLPSKHRKKYDIAARFVKSVRSLTPKITYYSEQGKFNLMENNQHFAAHFCDGNQVIQRGSNIVVEETSGAKHTFHDSSPPHTLPQHIQPLLQHFKQVYNHCLRKEKLLEDDDSDTQLASFPFIIGTKPPMGASNSPPLSSRSTQPVSARSMQPVSNRNTQPVSTRGPSPVSTRGTSPVSGRSTHPMSTRSTPSMSTRGTSPVSTRGTSPVPVSTRSTPSVSTRDTPRVSSRGTSPVSTRSTPPVSTKSTRHPTHDKENCCSSSLPSLRSPQNSMTQLGGSFGGSVVSVNTSGVPPAVRLPLQPQTLNARILQQPSQPLKSSPVRVRVPDIGWATKESNGEVSVEYLDGSKLQASSTSCKVVYTDALGITVTYSNSSKDNVPPNVREKLAQMPIALDYLQKSTTSKAMYVDNR